LWRRTQERFYFRTISILEVMTAITFDTATRLEWLDLSQTFGLSYNETLLTPFVTELGFRFATPADLITLASAVSVVPGSSVANLPGITTLLALLGCTVHCAVSPAGQGWLDMGHPTMTAYGFFQLNNLAGELDIPDTVFANRDLSPTDFFRTQTASFLIRERNVNPVSEPPILMLFGVAGLAMFARRFRAGR
jgi:hypothetical protein